MIVTEIDYKYLFLSLFHLMMWLSATWTLFGLTFKMFFNFVVVVKCVTQLITVCIIFCCYWSFIAEKENRRTEADRGKDKEVKEEKCRTCSYCQKVGRESQTATTRTIKGNSSVSHHMLS